MVGTGQVGTSLLGLRRGAEALGFNARQVKANSQLLDKIDQVPLATVIDWQGYHWVVLYGKQGKKYVIADPGVGIRYISREQLTSSWTNGVMLLLVRDASRFYEQESDQVSGLGRFIQRVSPYRHIFVEAIAINMVMGFLSLTSPFLLQILTDDVLVREVREILNGIVIAVVVMNMVSSILQLIQSNIISHFAKRLELGMGLEFARHIIHLSLSYYETRSSGEIISGLRDIEKINQLVSQVLVSLPSQSFIALISLGLMLFYSYKFLGIAVASAFVMSIST
ncbi:hypothetical protein RintRC_7551 [Richelia intracellularis]|nr:hypothetical protein RintRC_7551 [Richelia intracellularis]